MLNDYCFRRAVQGKLSKRNRRNTASVLRAVVKSHNSLKVGVLEEISKVFQNLQRSVLGSFIVKWQPVLAYKRLLDQLYQKRDAYTETLT